MLLSGSLHGVTAVAALKQLSIDDDPLVVGSLHGVTAVAALKLLGTQKDTSRERCLHGVTAVAALKPSNHPRRPGGPWLVSTASLPWPH